MDTTQPDLINASHSENSVPTASNDAGSSSKSDAPAMSKSERIRRYIQAHPEARNTEIVAALEEHGIKYQDVGNVRSQEKRKAAKKSAPSKRRRQVTAAPEPAATPNPPSAPTPTSGAVSMETLQAGAEFVKQAGGIDQAEAILALIRQIRSV
ncbi:MULTISPECIES: hypothetical protein [Rhodopirellula]|jgi:hypothetical protein|uniref:hypothetical protein n=1 Tax=Rhodopirellula TaxID=265488 RepID=UPI00257ED09F|nr:hypothetical protein [Rhodopirellula sp. UBA1907]MCR9207937.1 hypothetical protein [bacterium]